MSDSIQLRGVKAEQIIFKNNLEPGKKIELGFKFSFNLKYGPGGNCKGDMVMTCNDRSDPDRFSIEIHEAGFFLVPESMDRGVAHAEAFRLMHPFMRALTATVTANSGIAAVMIPDMNIDPQNVMKIEIKPPKADPNDN